MKTKKRAKQRFWLMLESDEYVEQAPDLAWMAEAKKSIPSSV